ncbi:MAG: hypothetical protein JZU65_02620 [Chlorobium sp.]|nr:hypothetical protein [Chlorobium sp.]
MEVIFNLKNDEEVLLRSDSMNYELCRAKNRTDDDGNVVTGWEPFKFFASLPQALNRVMDMKVRSSDAKSLKELSTNLEIARKEICDVWSTEVNMVPPSN